MASLTPAQHRTVLSLYRRALKQGHATFAGDPSVIAKWYQHVRSQFQQPLPPAPEGADAFASKVREWEDGLRYLRQNIVQGVRQEDTGAYRLKITEDTELGNNEDIKAASKKLASSGVGCCGGSGGAPSSTRAFSTMARRPQAQAGGASAGLGLARSFATSAPAMGRPTKLHTPRPVSKFPMTIVLNDGSSIDTFTSSPRAAMRLTRDPTNHPLWNPLAERSNALGVAVNMEGQLGRFQKKFSQDDFAFAEEDLDWMSGGSEASRGATVVKVQKKGKKK